MAKTIVITGAGDGLGRALARRFARDGETVILLGRTLAKVEAVAEELGTPALAIQCDVTSPESVRAAFDRIAEHHPRIDVLINNAGMFEPFALHEASDDKILGLVLTNLAGPIFCAREALRLLGRGGHLVNVTSESVRVKFPMLWMYEGTKVALEHISEAVGRELEGEGIRVSVVRAGPMMDETKTASTWPVDVAMRFHQASAAVGLDLRTRPVSHYDSVTDAFRAVIDMPPDVNLPLVAIGAWKA
ncbi:MAG: SDR family oxidoreductase [Novosphingobium sp.]|nr:SDR family oxidoreductase [Novosphingobium sp.]